MIRRAGADSRARSPHPPAPSPRRGVNRTAFRGVIEPLCGEGEHVEPRLLPDGHNVLPARRDAAGAITKAFSPSPRSGSTTVRWATPVRRGVERGSGGEAIGAAVVELRPQRAGRAPAGPRRQAVTARPPRGRVEIAAQLVRALYFFELRITSL